MIEESEAMKRLKSRNLLAEYRAKISKIPETQAKAKEIQETAKQKELDKILDDIFSE
jgi:hypothetical protein